MIIYLWDFPRDTDGPAYTIVSDQQGLHRPAPEVPERKYINMSPNPRRADVGAVNGVFLKFTSFYQIRIGDKHINSCV